VKAASQIANSTKKTAKTREMRRADGRARREVKTAANRGAANPASAAGPLSRRCSHWSAAVV